MRSPFSKPLKRSAKPIKRSRLKKKSRSKADFARIYGSKERVEFVKSLPCSACGVVGLSDNAHVAGESGVAYKADAEFIAPLCHTRWGYSTGMLGTSWITIGCHTLYDEQRHRFEERFPDFDAAKAARETQNAWIAFQGEKT